MARKWRAMRRRGVSVQDIAKEFGVARTTVGRNTRHFRLAGRDVPAANGLKSDTTPTWEQPAKTARPANTLTIHAKVASVRVVLFGADGESVVEAEGQVADIIALLQGLDA